MFKTRNTLCAVNKEVWEKDKSKFNCTSSSSVYHCIQDERNRSGEICIQPVWVQPHPVCLNKTRVKEISANYKDSVSQLWILGPILGAAVIIALAVFITCYVWRRKQKSLKQDKENNALLGEFRGPFHKTAAFHEAESYLKNDENGSVLVLTGIWGSGKTKTATEVLRTITGKMPMVIKDLEKLDIDENNQAVIFDEAIPENLSEEGKTILREKIKNWNEKMSSVDSKTKRYIIFTLHDELKSYLSVVASVVSQKEVKCISLSDSLTRGDRTQILNSHFSVSCPDKNFSKIENLATKGKNKSLGYPEICALFCRCFVDDFQKKKSADFCRTPLYFLKLHLEKMYRSEDKYDKFLLLVYMSLNEMEIDIKGSNEMLFKILQTCKRLKNTQDESPNDIEIKYVEHESNEDIDILSLISEEFVDKVPDSDRKYRLQHDVIRRMTLVVYGTNHFDKLLEYSKRKDLEGLIKEDGLVATVRNAVGDIIPFLFINREKWSLYEKKLLEPADH